MFFIMYVSAFLFHYWAARKFGYGFIWIILAVLLPFISTFFLAFKVLNDRKYINFPTVEEYMSMHPRSNAGMGIYCSQCGSNHIRSWGFSGPGDIRRLHSCAMCNTGLYRTGF